MPSSELVLVPTVVSPPASVLIKVAVTFTVVVVPPTAPVFIPHINIASPLTILEMLNDVKENVCSNLVVKFVELELVVFSILSENNFS